MPARQRVFLCTGGGTHQGGGLGLPWTGCGQGRARDGSARGEEGEHRACTRQRVRQHGWHRALAPRGRGCRQLSSCVRAAGEQRVGRECGRPLLSAGLGPGAGRASPCAALAARGLGGREGELRGCASSGRAACAEGAGSWRPLGGEAVRGRRGWRVRGFGDAGVAIRVGSVRGGRVVACGARELAAFEQRATSGWRGVWSVMEEERPSYRRGSRATSDRRAPPKRSAAEEKRRRRERGPPKREGAAEEGASSTKPESRF